MNTLRTATLVVLAAGGLLVFDAAAAWGQSAPRQDIPDAPKPHADTAAPVPPGPATATPPQASPPSSRPAPAAAGSTGGTKPTAEDIERAKVIFTQGRQLFDTGERAKAVEKFKEAYRLSQNPLLLYNIGFTYDELGKLDLALFYYEEFLGDASPAAQVYDEVTARVAALKQIKEANAVFDAGSMKSSRTKEEESRAAELMHRIVDEAPPQVPLDITAFTPESAGRQVVLLYRGEGKGTFESTLMRRRYNELVGRIPAAKVAGKSLQYYIEVRDPSGTVVARSGRATSPHLIVIDPDAPPSYYPDMDDLPTGQTARAAGGSGRGGGSKRGMDIDQGSSIMQYARWGSTAASASLLGLALSFHALAAQRAESLALDARRSHHDCGAPPCRSFSELQKNLERDGRRYETLTNITLAAGIATAGVAGYLWYRALDTRQERPQAHASGSDAPAMGMVAVPVVGDKVIGAAARFTF